MVAALVGSLATPVIADAAPACAAETATRAAALAMAARCGHDVEVAPAVSETSRVTVRPDGISVLEQHIVPVRVRRGDRWVGVDTRLKAGSDGSVAPLAAAVGLEFGKGGADPLVRMTTDGGTIELRWPSPLPAPVVEGDTAVYRSVLPGVDLRMRATAAGFGQVLVVRNAEAAANPALRALDYRLTMNGVTAVNRADGGIDFTGKAGAVVASTAPGLMWDSSGADRSTARGPGETARTAAVSAAVSGATLRVVPDAGLLTARDVAFPLYVDPPFDATRQKWAYARSTNSNNNDGIARVGASPDGGGTYRSFFEMQLGAIAGQNIVDARVYTTLTHSSACAATPVSLYATADFPSSVANGTRTTWSPALHEWLDEQWGNANEAGGCGYIQPDKPMEFGGPALTGHVQYAVNQYWSFTTLGLSTRRQNGTGESTTSYWKKFYPSTFRMTVWYNNPPNEPSARPFSASECYQACTNPAVVRVTQPRLPVSVADPQNGSLVHTDFEVRAQASDTATLVTSGRSGPTATPGNTDWQVPAGALADGGTYHWRARSVDEMNMPGPWTPFQQLTVDKAAPAPAAVNSAQYPSGRWGAVVGTPGTFTLQTGSPDVANYAWSIDGGSVTTVAATPGGPTSVGVTPAFDMAHTFSVVTRDRAGNTSTSSYAYRVRPRPDRCWLWTLHDATAADTGKAECSPADTTITPANGTPAGGVTFGPGYTGNAAELNGTSGQVHTALPVLDNAASFTVMAWVRLDAAGVSRTAVSQDGVTVSAFALRYDPAANAGAGGWCFTAASSDAAGADTSACTTQTPVVGQWTHIAGTRDTVTGKIRAFAMGDPQSCGGEMAEADFVGSWSASGRFAIGRGRTGGAEAGFWAGGVDDVRAHQRVLSASEICQQAVK
ncbi:putative large secreted protein [Alloactinosynnema sp. L-07]|nr:putative large secreted protein [Alloactinosynnema sp. L-07]